MMLLKKIKSKLKELLFTLRLLKLNDFVLLAKNFFKRKILKQKIPAAVWLAMTFKCQFACNHCGISMYKKDNELELYQWKKVIDELVEMGIPRIHFSGGEALLKQGIEELICYAADKGRICFLDTNGWLLSLSIIRRFKTHGVRGICISLNGATAETHDAVCGIKGSFDSVKRVIKICAKEKMPCMLSTMVSKELIVSGELQAICDLGRELKADAIRLLSPKLMGNLLNKNEENLSGKQRYEAINIAYKSGICLVGAGPYEKLCKVADVYSPVIDPFGEVMPCGYIPYSFGNVIEEKIGEIFRRLGMDEMFAERTACKIQDDAFRQKYIQMFDQKTDLPIRLYEKGKKHV